MAVNNMGKKINKFKELHDCNIWFGINHLNSGLSVDGLKLTNYIKSISKRAVKKSRIFLSNYYSLFYDPVEGDSELENTIKGNEKLLGALVFPNNFLHIENEFEKYLINKFFKKFKILRLFPKTHKYCIEAAVFNNIYSILNKYCFPIMITLDELDITGNKDIYWRVLFEISNCYPDISLIIDGGNSKELVFSGYFYQLLKNTKNVFIETHNLLAFNQIENIVDNFGSTRLIFGSYFPFYSEFLSLERIRFSRINSEDKNNIL